MSDVFSDPVLAHLYAWENGAFDADVPFYRRWLTRGAGPVLDAGAGTGRVAVALARLGHEVHAVESSPVMLALAREGLAAETDAVRRRVTFLRRDLTRLRAPARHQAVVCAFNTLLHVGDADHQLRALLAMRGALRAGGRLLLEVGSPYAEILHPAHGQPRHVYTIPTEDGGHITLWEVRRCDLAQQVTVTHLTYDIVDAGGALVRRTGTYTQRWLFRSELTHMLRRAGFGDPQVFADYACTREPTDPLDRLLVVAPRARSRILPPGRQAPRGARKRRTTR